MVFRRPVAAAAVVGHKASNRTAAQMQTAQHNQAVNNELNQSATKQQDLEYRVMTLEQRITMLEGTIGKLEQQIQQILITPK